MLRTVPPTIILLFLALTAASPAAGLSGPLRVENAYPPLLPFLCVPAEGPAGLEPGELRLTWAATYGNTFHWDLGVLYPDLNVLLDGEVARLALDAGFGLGGGWTVGLRLWAAGAHGGVFDPVIQGFHALFGLPNADREHFPDNHFTFLIHRAGQDMVDLDQPYWAFGDLELSAKWTILDGRAGGFGAALQGAVSLPIGSAERLASNGALDASLGVLGSWRRSRFAAYAGLRYLVLGEPDWGAVLGFRPHNLGFFTCLEWAPGPAMVWLLQADGVTLPYLHPHRWLHGISGSISIGARIRLSRRLLLQVHASEELFSFAQLDISAGIAATLSL